MLHSLPVSSLIRTAPSGAPWAPGGGFGRAAGQSQPVGGAVPDIRRMFVAGGGHRPWYA